ncbi:MAG: thermonuclease family protein [Phascolarctobacterium sp.]|nr:thermonuclease family protein [Phascolarctobacterium sp.]
MLRISLSLLSVLIFFVAGCSIGESYFGPKSVSTYTNTTNKNLTSRVIHVSDGDTIIMLAPDGGKVKVRLYGIDAPEKAQPYGPQAAGILKNLILNQVVTIDTINVDRYGRYVAKVFYNRQDINAEMIRLGAAWHYRYYDKSPSYMQYEELERYARVNRRGLWNRDNPTPPWEYRKRIREQQGRK